MTPQTKTLIRRIHTVVFFVVFAAGLAAFGTFMVIREGASWTRADPQTEAIRDHGNTFFVTMPQARLYRSLMTVMVVGVPLVIVSALVFEAVLGVPMFNRSDRAGGHDA